MKITSIKKKISGRKIGLIGFGSIGKRHFKNLKKLNSKITIYDSRFSKISDLKYIYDNCEDVFICSPLITHENYLEKFMKLKKNIFIEKPFILNTKKLSKKIIDYNKKKIVYVGFNLRFREIIKFIKKKLINKTLGNIYWANFMMSSYLPNWRKKYNFRNSYTNSKIYGGVLLDSIHELDLAEYFFGRSKLKSYFIENLKILKIKSDEYANIILKHENKVISNIQLDYINKNKKRTIKICGSKKYLEADISNGLLNIKGKKNNIKKFKLDNNKEYVEEIIEFYRLIFENKENQNLTSNLNIHSIVSHIKKNSFKNL